MKTRRKTMRKSKKHKKKILRTVNVPYPSHINVVSSPNNVHVILRL